MEKKIKNFTKTKVECHCNWFRELTPDEIANRRKSDDTLLDSYLSHSCDKIPKEYICIECGAERRGHPKTHKWRIE